MSSRHYPTVPLLGTCVAIWRADTILLVKRMAGPSVGNWAMPGGLVEVGETLEEAAVREILEETALKIDRLVFDRVFDIISKDEAGDVERHYVLAMYVTQSIHGDAIAGDDAGDARWFTLDEMTDFPLTGRTFEYARESQRLFSQFK